ncbi:MAG: hypothetical protein R3D29_14205 [Nitratireductor sp.]
MMLPRSEPGAAGLVKPETNDEGGKEDGYRVTAIDGIRLRRNKRCGLRMATSP